jgi:tetraacyldisaccharide 4'-kinase
VILVSGLGNPLGFEHAAGAHGWLVRESLRFPDHHHYDAADVALIRAVAAQHQAVVVTTGKDAVKLAALMSGQEPLPFQVLEVDSAIAPQDQAVLDALLQTTLPSALKH